jgi:RNA-dependent RNA polymerase
MLDFFVDFANSEKLGRINNTHTVHADQSPLYASCKECKILATIHGDAVDYAKSGKAPEDVPRDLIIRAYPDFMEKWNKVFTRLCSHHMIANPSWESSSEIAEIR